MQERHLPTKTSPESSSSSRMKLHLVIDRSIMAAEAVSPTTILLILLAAVAMAAPRHAGATEYTVGDSDGWTNGPSYLAWSQTYNFTAGDTLVFNYVRRQHDVLQVTEDAFRTCEPAANRTVLGAWATGRDVVDLAAPGDYYFICNFTGHCLGGMKLTVTVSVPAPPPSSPPPTSDFATEPPPPPPSSTCTSSQRPDEERVWRIGVVVVVMWISVVLL